MNQGMEGLTLFAEASPYLSSLILGEILKYIAVRRVLETTDLDIFKEIEEGLEILVQEMADRLKDIEYKQLQVAMKHYEDTGKYPDKSKLI